ncbi:phage holin family protein [Megamonas rupellensis]|uniref:phage holin family protein n=1 Tax=Megamonas rupellensis TaxID=491921 RepID=UPI00241D557A|nr:phage holin family protein [Megamonas rupellensis]
MTINIDYLSIMFTLLFGVLDKFIIALVVIMVVDFITILFVTYYSKDILNFYDDNIKKRLIKKLYILLLIILAHELDIIIGEDMNIRNVTICFFIGSEGLNILENAVTMNISLPNILKKILERIQNKNK